MRVVIFALLLVSCPGVALSQALNQSDVEHSVRVLLTELSSGYIECYGKASSAVWRRSVRRYDPDFCGRTANSKHSVPDDQTQP
jgi:hypothetical protein